MQLSRVPTTNEDVEVLVQGFKRNEDKGFEPYVFVGTMEESTDLSLTPENAHILGEEIRKHAEFAASARKGE